MSELGRILGRSAPDANQNEIFAGFSDELWFWMNTRGYRGSPQLREILPALRSLRSERLRQQEETAAWEWSAARAFPDTSAALASYDRGEFVHTPTGANNEVLTDSFFGETCIPEGYVRSNWTRHLEYVELVDDRKKCPQNVIVVRKPKPSTSMGA